eukprot:1013499-Rhodomonas_salina.1
MQKAPFLVQSVPGDRRLSLISGAQYAPGPANRPFPYACSCGCSCTGNPRSQAPPARFPGTAKRASVPRRQYHPGQCRAFPYRARRQVAKELTRLHTSLFQMYCNPEIL